MTLALVAFAAYALLAFRDLRTAFFLFCALLPAYVIRFAVGGLPTTALEILFVILFAAWMLRREKRLIDIKGWGWLLLAWLAVSTVSMFVSPDFRAAAGVWKAYFVEPILLFLVANDLMRAAEDRRKAFMALGGSAVVIGLVALMQKTTGWGVPPPWNAPGEFRATAFYGFPNAIGLFLAPLVPVFAWFWRGPCAFSYWKCLTHRSFWFAATALSLAAILMARSEGALVGAATGLLFLGVMLKRSRLPTLLLAAAGLAALLAAPSLRAPVSEKILIEDWSGRVRKEMWGEAWTMLKDRPLLGAGLSGYPVVFAPYHKAGHIEIFQYPHALVLNFWSEVGLAGLAVFLLLAVRFLTALRRACLDDPSRHGFTAALGGAMIALLVHGLVDVPYFKNDLAMLFWLLLAMASSLAAEKKKASARAGAVQT